jgi:hypothetical protein
VVARNYSALGRWLDLHGYPEVTLTFGRVEQIIGCDLPASARRYRSWWGNDTTHSHANSWLSKGFFAVSVSIRDESVTFRWSRRLMRLSSENAFIEMLRAFGSPIAQPFPIALARQSPSTFERDKAAFEAMVEGLSRTGGVEITFDARVHDPPRRGRRTEPGYGTMLIWERDRPTVLLRLVFSDGIVDVRWVLGHWSLRRVSRWPASRQLAGRQFVGLWQQTQRFVLAWPSEECIHHDGVSLVGALKLRSSATPAECLRVCTWLLREAHAFEDGLIKVLYRKRPIYPMRALKLADKHLARYVPPTEKIATSLHRVWRINPLLFAGADEHITDSLREHFGDPFDPSEPAAAREELVSLSADGKAPRSHHLRTRVSRPAPIPAVPRHYLTGPTLSAVFSTTMGHKSNLVRLLRQ